MVRFSKCGSGPTPARSAQRFVFRLRAQVWGCRLSGLVCEDPKLYPKGPKDPIIRYSVL